MSLSTSTNWVPPPSKFSFLSPGKMHLDVLNNLSFMSVAFQPVKKEAFFLETQGVNGGAITQWLTDAPFGFVSKPKLALDKITIRFVTQGSIVRRNSRSDHLGAPGKAMFVAFDEMITEEASSGFQAFAGTIDRAALLACHIALEGTDEAPFPHFRSVADIDTIAMQSFRHAFHQVFLRRQATQDDGDLNTGLLEEMVIYQFLAAWPKVSGDSVQGTPVRPSWQVRRAMDYIEANLQGRLTLAEVASVARISVRSLQISFRRELGKTPVQWILERRLSKVRRDLVSKAEQDIPISTLARRWGFVHMSDFTRRYRHLFGETPSQTRGR